MLTKENGSVHWKRTLYACFIVQMLSMIGFSASIPFTPLFLLKDLNLVNAAEAGVWAGLMSAASALSLAVLAPVWGAVADRFGRKSMILRALIGGSVTVGLMAFCPNVWVLLFLRLLQGALSGTVPAVVALISTVTPKEQRGYALGMVQTSVFVGASIGPLIGGALADLTDYRMTFFITAVVLGIASLIVVFFVHEEFTPVKHDAQNPKVGFVRQFGAVFSQREFVSLVIILVLVQFSSSVIIPILALFIKALNGGQDGAASLAGAELAVTGIACACSAALAGRLSDKYGHRKILIISSIAAAIFYFPQAAVGNVWQLLILRGLMGLCFGGIVPSANALIAEVIPEGRKGAAFGWVSSCSSLGMAVGPIAGSIIAALLGNRAVFLVTAMTLLIAAFWIKISVPANREATAFEKLPQQVPQPLEKSSQ